MLGLLLVLGAIPQVGPELLLDSPRHGPAAGRQAETAIAMDSAGGLAVWIDSRTGSDMVFGARLDGNGGIIDQRGILIANLSGRKPKVALIGTNAYVVFISRGSGASQFYGVRIDRATGVATAPLRLSTGATDVTSGDVISISGNAWAFWVQSTTLSRAIVSMGASGVLSTTSLTSTTGPMAAAVSSGAAGTATVVFVDPANPTKIIGGNLDTAGPFVPVYSVTFMSAVTDLRLGSAQSSTFVAASLASGALGAVRVDGSANVTLTFITLNATAIGLDCNQTTCGYAWVSGTSGQLTLSQWDTMSGVPSSTSALSSIGVVGDVAVSHLTAGWVGAFSSNALGTTNVFLTSSGIGPSLLSVGANAQRLPSVTWDGQEFLVDLLDHSLANFGSNVFSARFTVDAGTAGSVVLLPNGFESVALTPWSTTPIAAITVASFENQVTNLWANPSTSQPNLDAGVVLSSGAVAARPRLAMQPSGSIGALCWNASGVNVALMTLAGISPTPLKVSTSTLSGQCEVALTSSGYLLVWREVGATTTTLRAMRLTASLVPVDVDGGVVIPAGATPSTPTIASTASTAVIAWAQNPGATTLAAAKFDLSTGSFASIPLPTRIGDNTPALVWTGKEMLLAYQSLDAAGVSDVVGVSIDPSAPSPSSSSVFLLATSPDPEFTPALASDRNGTVLLAYGRYDSSPGVHDQMVRLRVLTLPTVASCSSPVDCGVGQFCADGVCCNSACGNSNPSDCQACSVAAGGLIDGTCTLSSPTWVCAPAAMCTAASFCSGTLSTCPAPVGTCDAGVDAGPPDAGIDAGVPDAAVDAGASGTPDAGTPDAGATDAGVDAGIPDAAVDAGTPDAGADAGEVDGGLDDAGADAGPGDAGTDFDAGNGDAGPFDAGTTDAGQAAVRQLALGCGCSTTDSSTVVFALLALLLVRARRRAKHAN